MFLDMHHTSVGAFVVMADVEGSYGEVIHTQVGRFHKNSERALAAARRLADKHRWKHVRVVNRNNGWAYTVVV